MKDSERLFIVFYLDVSNINREDVTEYMHEFWKYTMQGYLDDSIKSFLIPINSESRIEFYSMKDMTPATEELLKTLENKFDEFIKEHNNG